MIVSLVVGCGNKETKEIKRLEEKIAALEKKIEADLPQYRPARYRSLYEREIAYLRVRKKSFQALQGDAGAYPIAREYFENRVDHFSHYVKECEKKVNTGNDEISLKWSLGWYKDMKELNEERLKKLERIHSQ